MSDSADRTTPTDHSRDSLEQWLRVTGSLSDVQPPSPPGAEPERIGALEESLGLTLDESHRRYLSAQDGWEPSGRTAELAGAPRIASVEWLHKAPHTFFGPPLEGLTGPATAQNLRDAGVTPGNYLVVAVDPFFGGSYLMPVRTGQVGPEVITVAGWVEEDTFVGDIYPSFFDFLAYLADSAEQNAKHVITREAAADFARRVWQAEPSISVFGPPDDDALLAKGILRLQECIEDIHAVGPWRLTARQWDGSPGDLERVLREATRHMPDGGEKLYLPIQTRLDTGATWQISVTRSRPPSPDDNILVHLRGAEGVELPAITQLETLIARAVTDLHPHHVSGSSVTANRTATELGIPQPAGFRVWLHSNQLAPSVENVDLGEFTVKEMGPGLLLCGPDHWAPEKVVTQAHELVIRMRASGPNLTHDAPENPPSRRGSRLTRWLLRSRR